MKSVHELEQELELKKAKIKAAEERVKFTADKLKLRKRELRDQVRYAIGGLILDHNLCDEFSGLKERLYQLAMTRDKKKMVEQGFHDGNIQVLKQANKKECKQSAKKAGDTTALTSKEMSQANEAIDKNVYRKIYGREKELFVFIGDNQKMYIADNVAKYLQESASFET